MLTLSTISKHVVDCSHAVRPEATIVRVESIAKGGHSVCDDRQHEIQSTY